ncbi:MAG TPA: hypothetical protein HPP77_05675 [Candidatus Hydrogenedentes bacterium]|nr:hypothetical protein [Candidatus Hydrogenedentota bacterium]HIJ73474.1 hypothetical protein [Candidatus Hydrogenedentota bacterium]
MFQSLLENVARGLDQRGIPYMIIGGQAVLLYGEPRQTKDIDVTLGVGPERLSDVQDLVATSGWKLLVESPEEFVAETMVLPCVDPASGIRLDFVFSFSPYERRAIARARLVSMGNTQVAFASLEDLIIHKTIAGRAHDLEDIRVLLLKHPEADLAEVRHWIEQFEDALGEPFLSRFETILESLK